ncbi:MAG TPA: HD domain-containing protein [Solirubrobacterales bacterium]|jgi:(p)ppGpp synthase/HD superfamily hydrolase|nr:HD domain-containing protein [Solirubrobacterales bacterium]
MPPSPRIDAAAASSQLVAEALEKARADHAGQVRNGSGGMPYIEHPIAVASLLDEHDFAEEVLAAALLHDVVEDSDTTVAELHALFGEPVAGLVAALSDDESIEDYRERKREHRARVADVDGVALAIYGADKLTNVLTLRRALAAEGAVVANEFKVPLALKAEAWEADARLLRQQAPGLPFLDELEAELNRLSADLAAAGLRRGT